MDMKRVLLALVAIQVFALLIVWQRAERAEWLAGERLLMARQLQTERRRLRETLLLKTGR
jgi:hypothetical protein